MKNSRGFTLVELIVISTIIGITAAIAAPNLWSFANNPLENARDQVSGNFKQARAKAMVATSAYRVRAVSSTRLIAESARNCTATAGWVADSDFNLDFQDPERDLDLEDIEMVLPTTINGVAQVAPAAWSLCYNSRGLANSNLIITLRNKKSNQTSTVEVFPGGSVEIR